jgi:NADH dehydrogenase
MLDSRKKVVIVGGGFGGLTAAKALASNEVDVTLIDSTNHHLFQPLLYQVATAALSAGDIASPLRTIVQGKRNIRVVMDEAIGVDRQARTVQVRDGQLPFDVLILAPGSRHSYFGHDQWEKMAPGLKALADALSIREHVLLSFEHAAAAHSTAEVQRYLRFAIVGGGPTGVELAGALAEIAKHSIMPDFPTLTPSDIRVILIEAGDRILAGFDEGLSSKAQAVLASLGVEVRLKTRVTDISEQGVYAGDTLIETANVIWAAGNEASPMLATLGAPLDHQRRVCVEPDLSIPGDPFIFVIGDAARALDDKGHALPALAPVAIQQGRYVARLLGDRTAPASRAPFVYKDRGMLATIGKAHAVVQIGPFRTVGLLAWLLWSVVHIFFLIGFRNRLRVMFEWIWYYRTQRPGSRLIIAKNGENRVERRARG